MPEMPEVQGLVEFLRGRIVGLQIVKASVAQIAALKTFDPQITALHGASVVIPDLAASESSTFVKSTPHTIVSFNVA